MIERGNLIIIAFLFLLIYYNCYKSENKKVRYLGYLALSISASIKIYPALFGMLTLKRRNIKETLHLTLMGIISFLIPFFCFEGWNSLEKMLSGLKKADDVLENTGVAQNYSLKNISTVFGLLINNKHEVGIIGLVIVGLSLLLAALLAKKEWQSLLLLTTLCIWIPSYSL